MSVLDAPMTAQLQVQQTSIDTARARGGRGEKSTARVSVLALIPATSGSRSADDRCLRTYRGKPLLIHSVEQGLAARNVDRVVVITDHPRSRALAQAAGAESPPLHLPAVGHLCTDLELFSQALEWLEANEGYHPEACVHLRPSCPTRSTRDVERAVDLLLADPTADSVRSVVKAPHTPYRMWRLGNRGALHPLLAGPFPEAWNMPRRSLPDVYLQNSAVDVVRASVIRERRSMSGGRVLPYVMDRLLDVDDRSMLLATLLTGSEPHVRAR